MIDSTKSENLSSTTGDEDSALPKRLKITLTIVFGVVALVVFSLIIYYAVTKDAKPSELNLGTVLVVSLIAIVLILLPWDQLGLRLKKVGFVEFEQVIKTQKKEQIESIVSLQNQINQLNQAFEAAAHVRFPSSGDASKPTGLSGEAAQESAQGAQGTKIDTLIDLIEAFLRRHPRDYFSPPRIRLSVASFDGFQQLGSYSTEDINRALQRMLLLNKVRTKISKKGNTLYGIR
jgi:hypothetical protein